MPVINYRATLLGPRRDAYMSIYLQRSTGTGKHIARLKEEAGMTLSVLLKFPTMPHTGHDNKKDRAFTLHEPDC